MLSKINVRELSNTIIKKYDLFICFNSFEKRCTTIATHIPKNQFNSFLVLTNEKHLEFEDNNLETLRSVFQDKVEVVELDLLHPIVIADKISDALEDIKIGRAHV